MAKGSDNEFPSLLIKEGATPTSPASGDQRLFVNSSTHHLERVNSSGVVVDVEAGGGSGLYTAYLCYQQQSTSGTGGGTATSGSWLDVPLNTEVADTAGHGAIGSNIITLDLGTYRVLAHSPFFATDACQLRLWNNTDSALLVLGGNAYARGSVSAGSVAALQGRFTIAGSKALKLQYQVQTTAATLGLGVSTSFGTEVYGTVELWKE